MKGRRSCIKFKGERKNYAHTGILKFEILITKEQGKTTKQLFENSLRHILEFTQKHAADGKSDFAILPDSISDTVTPQIRSHKDFPDHQIAYINKYFEMDNEWGFADLGKFVHRKMI